MENWVGEETFRDGIRAYLKKYSYGNAAAEDWWGTMTTATKQPFDAVMKSFVDQTGAPLLHASEVVRADGTRTVTITQERMLPKSVPPVAQAWTIPICAHEVGAAAGIAMQDDREAGRYVHDDGAATGRSSSAATARATSSPTTPPTCAAKLRAHLGEMPPAEADFAARQRMAARRAACARTSATTWRCSKRCRVRPSGRSSPPIAGNIGFLDNRLIDDHEPRRVAGVRSRRRCAATRR